MNPRINYVIATWDGKDWNESKSYMSTRFILDEIGKPKADQVLAWHLRHLSKLKHSLAQITIMKPTHHIQPKYDNYYANTEQELKEQKFPCPVITIETDHYNLYSYGQWLHCFDIYRDQFDYYIFMEDDTVAAIPYFDLLLTTLFQHRIPNQLGYLCTKVLPLSDEYYKKWDSRWATIEHMGISTGITNTKTLSLLFQTYPNIYNQQYHQIEKLGYSHQFANGHLIQINFSLLFTYNNLTSIRDYSDLFQCPFWMRESITYKKHTVKEYGSGSEPLIFPVTMVDDVFCANLGFLEQETALRRMKLFGLNQEWVELDLSGQSLHDPLFPHAICPSVRKLNLANNLISDVSIDFLLSLPLTHLNLDHNHISDEGLEKLTQHKTLTHLSILGNLITSMASFSNNKNSKEIKVDKEVDHLTTGCVVVSV